MVGEIKTHVVQDLRDHGGEAKFIDGVLVNIAWQPTEIEDWDGLSLSAENIHTFASLMRFLRDVEKVQLKLEYHAYILASNSGHGETQIWFEKPKHADLEGVVQIGAHIYEDRFGVEPNTLILNDKDDSDIRFWKGKIRRVNWLLPTHFRLTFQVEDAQETE